MRLTASILIAGCALALAACADAPTAAPAPLASADGAWLSTSDDNNGLLGKARGATAKYHQVEVAVADGYISTYDCVSIPGAAMGIHYIKPQLAMDGNYDVERPEVLVYEPQQDGKLKLVALEYIVLKAASPAGVPPLLGAPFDLVGGPMGPMYALHLWAWRENPDGIFAPFNTKASCPSGGAPSAASAHAH